MIHKLKKTYYTIGAGMTAGILAASSGTAHATNNFNAIASNITSSIADLPGLLAGLSYMFGLLLAVLGIMKIKDHVENPSQTPLKDGAIRLLAGGALFALPIISDAMFQTVGNSADAAKAAKLNAIPFSTNTGGGTP